ncbi:hypothetical protein [Kaarinaea lacus]
MKRYLVAILLSLATLILPLHALAADSYRYVHVTIDTPWAIFLFLLVFILAPFVLMAILYWYFAYKKSKEDAQLKTESQETPVD